MPDTLVDVVFEHAQQGRRNPAYVFLPEDDEPQAISFVDLHHAALRIAGAIQQTAAQPGDRALLLYPPGLDYVAAFLGSLYAGVIAVPTYPIGAVRENQSTRRLQGIVADCSPRLVLTHSRTLSILEQDTRTMLGLANAIWLDTVHTNASQWNRPALTSDSIAFLQYTSGSTAQPKGVIVSHGNLLANERAIQLACGHTEESTFAGWLPLFHDMGLIGNVLQPLYLGATSVLMSPLTFLRSPLRWLQAISKYRAVTSGGPNFAYDLCVRKIAREECADLDLSSWRIAFNGAEPVREETLVRFAAAFAHCGFRKDACFPCYGLAEATLMVSGGPPRTSSILNMDRRALTRGKIVLSGDEGDGSQSLVGCGATMVGQEIRIVNPDTFEETGESEIGEIWVKGPAIARGYWNRPDESRISFQATIAGQDTGPFLRTGDLGFLLDGQLFIAGRRKDLIIIRGRNYYPQDIEKTVEEAHVSFRKGCSAAFAVEMQDQECLVVLQEVERRPSLPLEELCAIARRKIVEHHGIQAHAVVLIQPGAILKTTSGKIQRSACRTAFLEEKLAVLYCDVASADALYRPKDDHPRDFALSLEPALRTGYVESYIVTQIAVTLKQPVESLDVRLSLASLGLDSLAMAELACRIQTDLGVRLALAEIVDATSITALTAKSVALLEAEDHGRETIHPSPIAAEDGARGYRLSHGEKAFWFIQQAASDATENNLAGAVRLDEDVRLDVLEECLQYLVDRHASLRAVFGKRKGKPVRRYQDPGTRTMEFVVIDASEWRPGELAQAITDEARKPFDLLNGPLVRVHVFTVEGTRPTLLFVFHHIVVDFWSIGVLMSEMAVAYSAFKAGRRPELPLIEVAYEAFVEWQEKYLKSDEGAHAWSYWLQQLNGKLPVLELPVTAEKEPSGRDELGWVPISFPAGKLSSLKEHARAQGVTLYVYLLAIYAILLHRQTGQDDLIIGSPAAGRGGDPRFRSLVGCLVNSLALRVDCSGDPRFPEFVQRVQQVVLGALKHQSFPFSHIVERLGMRREAGRTPVFQTMFVWQQSHLPALDGLAGLSFGLAGAQCKIGELTLESLPINGQTARFDLTLFATESASGLQAVLRYRKQLFTDSLIEGLARQFEQLLSEIECDPARPISEFSLVKTEDEVALIEKLNPPPFNRTEAGTIVQFFEEQAAKEGDKPAVVYEQSTLTFSELNCRANRLAHYLRQFSIGAEDRVGLLLPRGADAIVAILGILKAGAAYVPLEASDPPARLAFILRDCGASLLVTHSSLQQLIPEKALPRLLLDHASFIAQQEDYPSSNPEPGPRGDTLAYVIYTSGSTGEPKGVLVQNGSVANLARGLSADIYSRLGQRQLRVGLNAPLSFDGSVKQLLCLCMGHTLYVVAEETRRDAAALRAYIERNQLDVMDCTPSVMEMLYAVGFSASAASTVFLIGGEPIREQLWAQLMARSPHCVNVYGPTECTVDASTCFILPGTRPSIGRPLSTTRVYILDSHLRPVPIGVKGEIFIGGGGVARGYNARSGHTAERFLPDPFASSHGARMYRSGDAGRYLPDGRIEYLGRIDRQLKIRGFRIEPEEIEATLLSCGEVRDAAVVLREIGERGSCLVAYVVSNDANHRTEDLKRHLLDRLPEHMVPAIINFLPEIPRNSRGKRDLQRLPSPELIMLETETVSDGPRSPIEQALVMMWKRILGLEHVGIHQDFFLLGGHSLLATKLITPLQEVFQADVPLLSQFFQEPTVAGLAQALAETPLGRSQMDKIAGVLLRLESQGADVLEEAAELYNVAAGTRGEP